MRQIAPLFVIVALFGVACSSSAPEPSLVLVDGILPSEDLSSETDIVEEIAQDVEKDTTSVDALDLVDEDLAPVECTADADCLDDLAPTQQCKAWSCVDGFCEKGNVEDGTPCADEFECTYNEVCQLGECVPEVVLDCNDGNSCTEDSCTENQDCLHEILEGPCEDGNLCTVGTVCSPEGECVGGTPMNCDDGNPCTDDACEPDEGCVFSNVEGACDDGNACTFGDTCTSGDYCSAGQCVGSPVICNDNDICTSDSSSDSAPPTSRC